MTRALSTLQYTRLLGILLVAVGLGTAEAQTKITPDPNKYSLQQDVELGQEAAAEARKQLPMLNDSRIDNYVERVGENLVDAIPPEFRHAGFRYTFDVVNQKEINAFALPGGPMFLNRGMIEASRSEGEMAGVMAHEISHVILRHGTAQATKGQKFQTAISVGATLLSSFLGRKRVSISTLGRATTAARGASRSMKEADDVGRAEENVASITQKIADLDAEFKAETATLERSFDLQTEELGTVSLKPKKVNIDVKLVALAWAPYFGEPSGEAKPAF